MYVTTNYDNYLYNESGRTSLVESGIRNELGRRKETKIIFNPQQLKNDILLCPGAIIHFHGSIQEPESMIITTAQYLEHYTNKIVQSFLEELFDRYTVLFLGYGLEELEILEYIFRKIKINKSRVVSFFMLSGFYIYEENIFKHLAKYFKEIYNVEIICFNLDDNDHDQLEKVIENWSHAIEVYPQRLANKYDFIMRAAHE